MDMDAIERELAEAFADVRTWDQVPYEGERIGRFTVVSVDYDAAEVILLADVAPERVEVTLTREPFDLEAPT